VHHDQAVQARGEEAGQPRFEEVRRRVAGEVGRALATAIVLDRRARRQLPPQLGDRLALVLEGDLGGQQLRA
jgi:hypothetical protein